MALAQPRAVADAGPPTTDRALLDSTLMTSAPWSERIRVADGPAWIQVKSSTRRPGGRGRAVAIRYSNPFNLKQCRS